MMLNPNQTPMTAASIIRSSSEDIDVTASELGILPDCICPSALRPGSASL